MLSAMLLRWVCCRCCDAGAEDVDARWQEARVDGKGMERAMAMTRECPDLAEREAASKMGEIEEFWFYLPGRA